jgi:hypothetical protein
MGVRYFASIFLFSHSGRGPFNKVFELFKYHFFGGFPCLPEERRMVVPRRT